MNLKLKSKLLSLAALLALLGSVSHINSFAHLLRFLHTVEMMKDMKPFERKRLTPFLTVTSFAPGEVIVAEGDEADAMYFLREGDATATIEGVGEVRRYEGGMYFGELALLMGSNRAATVTAGDSGTSCYRLGADHFRDVPKYVRLSFMKHAAFAYAKDAAGGDRGLGRARNLTSVAAKSESELRRYIEATILEGKRMRPVSQRKLDDYDGNSSDSSSDSDYDDGADAPSPLPAGQTPESSLTGNAKPDPPARTKSVTFGPVVESNETGGGRLGAGNRTPPTAQPSVLMKAPAQAQQPKEKKLPTKKRGGCCASRPSDDD